MRHCGKVGGHSDELAPANDDLGVCVSGQVHGRGLLLFIGTRLVTHALSCVHSAFASCE